jgi:hypothetical protein
MMVFFSIPIEQMHPNIRAAAKRPYILKASKDKLIDRDEPTHTSQVLLYISLNFY